MTPNLAMNLGTLASVGTPPAPGFDPEAFPLSTAKFNGDSRTQAVGSRVVNASSLTAGIGFGGIGSMALVQALCGNKFLLGEGYQHAIGGSTSLAHFERDKSTAITTTGNPANAITSIASDAQFSSLSDGAETCLTQSGNHVFSFSVGVNDNSGTAAAYYNSPSTASKTLEAIADIADAYGAAGKVWYVGNEAPRGNSYWVMESRTVTGGTCTASRTTNFIDGETFGAVGAVGVFASGDPRPLTKVASAPGQDEYTVTSGGVFTFGGTAPTTAYISYNASPSGAGPNATYNQLRIIKEFMESSAENFVSTVNSVDYGIPGLKYLRPWVRVVDTFGALVDPDSGATQLPLPGTADSLQLHGIGKHSYLVAEAFKAAIEADYPDAPDLSTAPTRNNWYAARGTNIDTTLSGTLPVTMRSAFTGGAVPTLISSNGVPIGRANTSTGAITGTGITSGSLDFATGAWSITFAVAVVSGVQIWFEQDIGNFDVDTLTEGTIGRNSIMNGLMDMTPADGTNLPSTTGASAISTVSAAEVPYGWTFANTNLQTAITNGTMRCTAISGTDPNGFPHWSIELDGTHTASVIPSLTNGAINGVASRFTAGDLVNAGAEVSYAKHGTIGRMYGVSGSQFTFNTTSSAVSRSSPSGPQDVTVFGTRVGDAGFGIYVPEEIVTAADDLFSSYRLAPLLDTTGVSWGTTSITLNLPRTADIATGIPIAYRAGYGRVQARRRNDVA